MIALLLQKVTDKTDELISGIVLLLLVVRSTAHPVVMLVTVANIGFGGSLGSFALLGGFPVTTSIHLNHSVLRNKTLKWAQASASVSFAA
jgi:xanthosine utilization system XapX-like protein